MLLVILKTKKLLEDFTKKIAKTKSKMFRVTKVIKRKDNKLYVNTARKAIFSNTWKIMGSSKSPSKYHLSFNFMDKERPYYPSPKHSKQEVCSNH